MTGKATPSDTSGAAPMRAAPTRNDKLKAALKANIARRKAQAAARGPGHGTHDGTSGNGSQEHKIGPKG